MLQKLQIFNFTTSKGKNIENIKLTYQVFGKPLHQAPIVLVNHTLTSNSAVCEENGWWSGLIGKGKSIDTNRYTILCFNIPGNGYSEENENLFDDYKIFTARDIASIFAKGLDYIGVKKLYAVIGGSLGGGITWELAALLPTFIEHLIPIATDWKSTDWVKGNCLVREHILLNSSDPIKDARLHSMLIYRSPESFKLRFNRSYNDQKNMYNIESWLLHHGDKLKKRFTLSAYKLLNHVVANIDITAGIGNFLEVAQSIQSDIHIISIDSDMFFMMSEDQKTVKELKKIKKNVTHGIIKSPHGHDAFLIEIEQLGALLQNIFKKEN